MVAERWKAEGLCATIHREIKEVGSMVRTLAMAVSALVLAAPIAGAYAQDLPDIRYSQNYQACIMKAKSDGDAIVACENAETAKQDAALNVSYKSLLSILHPYRRNLLEQNERAWIAFRDSECTFRESELIGGPIGIEAHAQLTLKTECLLNQTYLRVRALGDDYTRARENSAN